MLNVITIVLVFFASVVVRYEPHVPSSVIQCVAENSIARSLAIACDTQYQLRPLLGDPECVDDYFGPGIKDVDLALELGRRANELAAAYTSERGYTVPRAQGVTRAELCLFAEGEISDGTGVGELLVEQ